MSSKSYGPYYQNSWALVVGINAYKYVAPLSYACNDADVVTKMLTSELSFPASKVIQLKDEEATKHAILEHYIGLTAKACDPNDRVVVFFAGHGATFNGLKGPIGFLIPVEGNPKNLNTLIRWDDLTRNADLIPAKHILFIMDACYSGLALQRAVPAGTERFLTDMLQRPARQVITAGKADEVVADGGGPQGMNSIFTGFLIEGLSGSAADANGVLTGNGLMAYVYQRVGQDNSSNQTPHYGHLFGDGDILLRLPHGQGFKQNLPPDLLVKSAPEMPEVNKTTQPQHPRPSFANRSGYGHPADPNFGRNDWSDKLVQYRRGLNLSSESVKALSWLSVIFEPVSNQTIELDIAQKVQQLPKQRSERTHPFEQFMVPRNMITTVDSLILYEDCPNQSDGWLCYLRIDQHGNIEYADSYFVLSESNGLRLFNYVQLIGIIWQLLYFAKHLLTDAGYYMGTRLLVNLVGTRDTILADFSEKEGQNHEKWCQPFDPLFSTNRNLSCHDPNLQLQYDFTIGDMDESMSSKLVKSIATKLGLAYNHQSAPRCFNYNTEIFPWKQFLYDRR